MSPKSTSEQNVHVDASIRVSVLAINQLCVSEPPLEPLEEEKNLMWKQVLIPFTIFYTTPIFLGYFPNLNMNLERVSYISYVMIILNLLRL